MSDPAGNAVSLAGIPSGIGTARGAAAGGLVSVDVNGVVVNMLAARDVTFAAGDPVAFLRAGQLWVAVCRTALGVAPDPLEPNPTPPLPLPDGVTGLKTLLPVETRSWDTVKWRTDTDDVIQGVYGANPNHTGCAFYGVGPMALAGATVTSAMLTLRRRTSGGAAAAQPLTLRLVTQTTRPAGAPTLTSSTAGPSVAWGQLTTADVPAAWAQAMVDGTAGGIAVFEADGSPYVVLDGKGRFSSSLALSINYTRTL